MMKQVLVNYIVKPEKIGENIALIKDVFLALKSSRSKGVKYSVYRMGENVFIHIAQFETEEANNEFRALEAFKAFRKDHSERQVEKPITNDIEEIGNFSSISPIT
ncbi:antibiotic biosynthesis monooxygenase family protein [Chitinophaga niabensis]|uniref:Antibiotic biosynthesis monooxygenase n=1 Tax=Chitinophaga niabensis TaxID=536979 RepID=A0A1N6J050_9BACT|nr:hypothetical protein [Chitinophaga niabensis]SIO37642.1 hypothetical protein SAMN04488055_3507 [Chitinophaga niabensis]